VAGDDGLLHRLQRVIDRPESPLTIGEIELFRQVEHDVARAGPNHRPLGFQRNAGHAVWPVWSWPCH
jgi:hypothetical protein